MTAVARQNRCRTNDQPCERERDRKLQSAWHSVPSLDIGAGEIRAFVRFIQGFSARYCAATAVPANWQRATPAIAYSSPRNETLTVPLPVGVR